MRSKVLQNILDKTQPNVIDFIDELYKYDKMNKKEYKLKTTTKENSLNYQFTVVKIDKLTPIENADRIQTASIFDSSTNIVVSKDNVSVGDIMVYFPSGTKLDFDFCKFNNLFEDVEKNFDKSKKKGYINNKQRVRAIKLKGIISDGLLLPPNCFNYCGISSDDVIDSLGVSGNNIVTSSNIEMNICEKYIVIEPTNKNNNKENNGKKLSYKVDRLIENQFYLHNDTANLRKNIHKLNLDDRVTINYKKHGCLPGFQLVNMYDGSTKKIKDIVVGDIVLGYNHNNGEVTHTVVLDTFINGKADKWYRVTKNCKLNDSGKYKTYLYLSDNHEVFINGYGYKRISDCSIGDEITTSFIEPKLTPTQISILTGILMSDGTLDRHNTKYAIRFGHKEAHEPYLDYIDILLNGVCTGHKTRKISGYGTPMVLMSTKQLRQINNIFNDWLISGRKEVPNGFKLDKWILAFWYMGDGSLHHHILQKDRADFAICGFSDNSVDNLRKALNDYGFNNFRIYRDTANMLRLKLNATDASILFDDICDIVPPIMQYKLPLAYRNKFNTPIKEDIKEHWFSDTCSIKEIDIVSAGLRSHSTLKYDIKTTTSNFFASDMLIHNSSAVFSNILVKKQLNKWYERLLKKLFDINIIDTEYDIIYSSRKVVKNQYLNNNNLGGGFYGEDLWGTVAKEIGHLIPKNYTLYGEILGYTENGKEIQKGYDYGCLPNQHKFFVYKISVVNPDGYVIYLNDNQIKEFCDKNGLNFSETFFFSGTVRQLLQELVPIEYQYEDNFNSIEDEYGNIDYKWRSILLNALESKYNEKDCFMCKSKKVPEEGIVLRIENSMYNYDAYKLKSKRFLLHESEEQEQGITNIEDSE